MSRFRLPLRLALLCALPVLGSCGFLGAITQRPTVVFKRMELRQVDFEQLSCDFVLGVTNPNVIGIDLATLSYQITVDGHAFVAGSTHAALHVPASGVGEARVPVSIRFVEFARSLEALFHKRSVAYVLTTHFGFGTPIGVLDVPLSTSGDLPVPQLPEMRFVNAGLRGVSMGGADLAVVIGVRNPNAFAVETGRLQYALKVAGASVLTSMQPVGRVAANGTSQLAIGAHLDFIALGMGVFRAVQGGGAEVAVDGQLDLGIYKAPLHLGGRL